MTKHKFLVRGSDGEHYEETRECSVDVTEPTDKSPFCWEIDHNQMARDEKSGEMIQFVTETSKDPLQVFENRPVKEHRSVNTSFSNAFDDAVNEGGSSERKNALLVWFGAALMLMFMIIAIVVLKTLF